MNTDEAAQQVLSALSVLIMSHGRRYYSEYAYPSQSADESEAIMEKEKAKVKAFREIRQKFEDACLGVAI